MTKITVDPLDGYTSLLDILETAAIRYKGRCAFGLFHDNGARDWWSFEELDVRSRAAAWRLRSEHGLSRGDRLLTWSPSTPEVPAVFFGAMRAGVVLVPLDPRMAPDTIARIAADADANVLALGEGPDAPDARALGIRGLRIANMRDLIAPDPRAVEVDAWERAVRGDLFEILYTSGTTGKPKGVMVTHGNALGWMEGAIRAIQPREHRVVSLIPLSHIFGQIAELFYTLLVGAEVLYVRSLNPKTIFRALRAHRVTTMATMPMALELFWKAIEREVRQSGKERAFARLRKVARHLPFPVRRVLFAQVHRELGGELRLFASGSAYLPPAIQQAWEDIGVRVIQGYGATECGLITCTREADREVGTVGLSIPPNDLRFAADGEILVRGPGVFQGYWRNEQATRAVFDDDGYYRTGDLGERRADGAIVLRGRKKEMIALPNGFKVFPEDVENALRDAGVADAVVLETAPGRIEAVLRRPSSDRPDDGSVRSAIEAAVRAANARLGIHQRLDSWRFWPDDDLPRTHTMKIKRSVVRDRILGETGVAAAAAR